MKFSSGKLLLTITFEFLIAYVMPITYKEIKKKFASRNCRHLFVGYSFRRKNRKLYELDTEFEINYLIKFEIYFIQWIVYFYVPNDLIN